jgi:uncharacterized repeat protein (TIGR03803 family)
MGQGEVDGANPHAAVTPDANGNIFGVAFGGGAHGYGVVFEIPAAAIGSNSGLRRHR